MQFARFVGMLGLLFVLGLAGFAIGCGSEQGSTGVSKYDGKIVKGQRKKDHQQLLERDKGASTGSPTQGKNRGPTGP
jgi:hypothetical protein